jgi:hypothetical protein
MIFPVDEIKIKITGTDEELDALLQYWHAFSYNHLKVQDTYPRTEIERNSGTMELYVSASYSIPLCAFESLVIKFNRLNFKFYAILGYSRYNHILRYQNGKKTQHYEKYDKRTEINENDYIKAYYLADHVNNKLKILEEYISEGNGYSNKVFNIVYENYKVDYVDVEKYEEKPCEIP